MKRLFGVVLFGLMCIFGTTVARAACTSNQIDVLGDGTQCETAKFTITTIEVETDDNDEFLFGISAQGTFYVDCGTGGTLSGVGVSGKTIDRTSVSDIDYIDTYVCTYENDGIKTIRFGGLATGYGNSYSASAITFSNNLYVGGISGSLGAIFPTVGTSYPRFYGTFAECTNLSGTIPGNLFSGVTGGTESMFESTFEGCSGLTGTIPAGLFSGISVNDTSDAWYMFYGTFYECSGLTGSIPADLFSGVSACFDGIFESTFNGCSGLSGYVPPTLFPANNCYMWNTFDYSGLNTECTGGMVQYMTGYEDGWGGKVSCVEPFVVPIILDNVGATTLPVPSSLYLKYGTGWYSDSATTNQLMGLTTLPTKTGSDFGGYWTEPDGSGEMVIDETGEFLYNEYFVTTTDESVTLYAYWPKKYNVTYSCGGGTGTPPTNVTVREREYFTPAANTCAREGYIFTGWAISGTSDVETSGFTWEYDEDKTLTAQWEEAKFTVTTTEISSGGTFSFYISAKGTFYVDCGEGGRLSGTYVSGNTIQRTSSTSNTLYTCTYDTAGVKMVRFGGRATGYNNSGTTTAAIRFYGGTPSAVAGISGSLGAIFPTVGTSYPRFYQTFYNCSNLTGQIPEGLFDGVTGTASNMFYQTFYNCTNLSGYIPVTLFSGITTYSSNMMYNTFNNTGLATTCPVGTEQYYTGFESYWNNKVACGPETPNPSWNLGSAKFGVTTANLSVNTKFELSISAKGNFTIDWGDGTVETLNRTSNTTNTTYSHTYTTGGKYMIKLDGLATGYNTNTSTPTIKFISTGITGLYGSLGAIFPTVGTSYPRFYQTFYNCSGLMGSIPADLFDGVTGTETYMFYQTFYGCSGLTGSIPADLFDGVTGNTKNYMFYQTFADCTNLSGYIPPRLFEGLKNTSATQIMGGIFGGSGISTMCPNGMTQYYTGFEVYFGDKVSCTESFITPIVLNDSSADTTSVPTTVYVKYGTGWYSNSAGTTAISQLTTNPTKTGMRFDGYWTTTNGGGVQVIDDTGNFVNTDVATKISKLTDTDVTVYANWVNDYTVTYSCGDGAGTPPASVTATSGKDFTVALNTGCYKDGYILSEWLVSNGQSKPTGSTFVWNYNEDKTFTAQWVESKFAIQTINLNSGDEVSFQLGARGIFYVDFDDGMTYKLDCHDAYISCTGTGGSYNGNATRTVCTLNNVGTSYEGTNIPHQYTNGGVHTIRFGGVATSYKDAGRANCGVVSPAIKFDSAMWLARVLPGGNLSALFPHFGTGITQAVRFLGTFRNCKNLSSIPEDLFSGYTVPNTYMFDGTFAGCSGLTGSISENLFAGLEGPPASYLFYKTFYGCSGLTGSIPENLFAGIEGPPASYMFAGTFAGCSGLTGSIPENLFVGIDGAPAQNMFGDAQGFGTFTDCSGLTGSIPENLFASIEGAPAEEMFYRTFAGCSGLTGSIPENLFAGIEGAPALWMFSGTFKECSGLTGSIPENLFAGIEGTPAQSMFSQTFYGCTGLTGSIPNRLFGDLSGTLTYNKYYFQQTFYNCTHLSGYVPKDLFSGLRYASSSHGGIMNDIFNGTGLETSCPPCYIQYITGFEDQLGGKVACQVGLDEGEFFYNGVCTTNCQNGGTKLMLGNGSEFPVLSTKVTNPALNVNFGSDAICYVPLMLGNAGSGSLNLLFDGQTYHAGTMQEGAQQPD